MSKASIRVLLVEDNPSDANLLGQMFLLAGKDGWELVQVERLRDAIEACSQFAVDVVLLDLSLPESEGLDTLIEFQASVSDIPIVVLTGMRDEEFAYQALAQGAQDYLFKEQITPQLLVQAVRCTLERGQIFKQLRESERRFRGTFEQTFQFMGLLTPEGLLLEVNQSSLDFCGATSPEELLNQPIWEAVCWRYSQAAQEWLRAAIASAREGELVREEVQVCGAGQKIVWVDFSLKPLKNETGNVVFLIAEGRDISDRKQSEAQIFKALFKERELNQMKLNFVSTISHEFRTPLTTIRSSKDLLERYYRDTLAERTSKHFERIQASVDQITELLDAVLLLGKAEAGKLKFEPAPIEVVKFCRDLAEELQLQASGQHRITFTHSGQYTTADLDENLLQRILTNLLSNAIKYSPAGGTVKFELFCQDEGITFRIQDQGIGIPPEDLKSVFESFHRASNVGQIKGTGLGLCIVKKSVDLHGGQITVESTVGVGTTFIVKLPR